MRSMTYVSFQNSYEKVYKRTIQMSHKNGLEVVVNNTEGGLIVLRKKDAFFTSGFTIVVMIEKIDEERLKVAIEAKPEKHWFGNLNDQKLKGIEEQFISNLCSWV